MAGYIGSKASVVSSGAERKKTFAITTSTTSLTGLVYTPNMVHVFHNGIRLVDGTDYTATDGTTITLTNAAANGDEVVVVSYATFSPADAYTKTEADNRYVELAGDTLTGALTGTDLTLSGGLYLGGTGSANKLDDYEEGTWTPTHSGNTMTGSGGHYVKVGKIVSIIADVTAPSGSATTSVITGLPFTAISTHAAVYVGYTNTASGAAGGYTSGSQIHFIQNGGFAAAYIAAGERVIFSATYYTDS